MFRNEMVKRKRNMCFMLFENIRNKFGYFGDMTNMHGIRNVFSMSRIPYLKRLFWSGILLLCCFGAWSVLLSALQLFSTGVASYSVETNHLDWDTPFPAVTICDGTSDYNQVIAYLKKYKKPTVFMAFYKDVAYWNVKYCKICDVCKVNVSCEEDFAHGVKEIRYTCADMLTDCWWGGKHFRCCDIFAPIATEFGECYVFNSALVGNTSILTVNRKIGLPDLTITAVKMVDMIVHAPEDIVSIALENLLDRNSRIPLVTELEVILKVEQTVNDASVRSLPPSMRGCLFKEERPSLPDWPFKEYTYSACLLYCRVLAQSSLCNCTHHFLANIIFDTPACDINGLICLYRNKGELLSYQCNCPMACDDTQYKLVHIFFERVNKSLITRGTRAKVRLAQLPSLRVRRLAIKDTLGMVVDIGGVGGVFFGASLLSVIELIYLFFIRRN